MASAGRLKRLTFVGSSPTVPTLPDTEKFAGGVDSTRGMPSADSALKRVMAITLINPDGLPKVAVYRQVSVATGSKLIFIAGQVARTADGRQRSNNRREPDLLDEVEAASPPIPHIP